MKIRVLLAVVMYIGVIVYGIWTDLPLDDARPGFSFLIFTLIYIAVWTVLELWVHLVWGKRKLLYQTLMILAGFSGVWLITVMIFLDRRHEAEELGLFYFMSIAGWLIALLTIKFFLQHKWKSMGMLVSCMDKVSKGEYCFGEKKAGTGKVPDNEFGQMWTAMERMCRNLQAQRYRHQKETEYLYQYAPRNFEQLFSKEKLKDIETGETVRISATVGIIAVIDKDTLLTEKLQGQYVQYANQLMEQLFSQKESKQAIFLQNGSNLENVKVIFKEDGQSALTAVKYSIDCMEALAEQTQDRYDATPFILLHTSVFSCGLAGGSMQVYPYVTSIEMEILNKYVDRFKANGTGIVVTENTWQQIKEHFQGRFIGYVASGGEKERDAFRLYEILDACPQSQKTAKLKNKENFESALRLYYDNNLYLARSLFADILKECPEDGISRWYVFACEERFNREGIQDDGHELFR